MSYEQIYSDEGVALKADTLHRLACCDCGLVHKVVLSVGRGKEKGLVGLAMARDLRATAAHRRSKAVRERILELAR